MANKAVALAFSEISHAIGVGGVTRVYKKRDACRSRFCWVVSLHFHHFKEMYLESGIQHRKCHDTRIFFELSNRYHFFYSFNHPLAIKILILTLTLIDSLTLLAPRAQIPPIDHSHAHAHIARKRNPNPIRNQRRSRNPIHLRPHVDQVRDGRQQSQDVNRSQDRGAKVEEERRPDVV